MISCS